METLKIKHASLAQALNTLKEAIELFKDPQYAAIYNTLRDSAILRFNDLNIL